MGTDVAHRARPLLKVGPARVGVGGWVGGYENGWVGGWMALCPKFHVSLGEIFWFWVGKCRAQKYPVWVRLAEHYPGNGPR